MTNLVTDIDVNIHISCQVATLKKADAEWQNRSESRRTYKR